MKKVLIRERKKNDEKNFSNLSFLPPPPNMNNVILSNDIFFLVCVVE